jgi:hypothetical protein
LSYYRTGTYVAFHAGGTTDPIDSDIKYYRMLKAWAEHKHIDFRFADSHEKTAAVRDTSLRATLQRRLIERMKCSKQMLLILTEETRCDTDWVPFEIKYAVDSCEIPIIAAYPGYNWVLEPASLRPRWPQALRERIDGGTARVVHIPFRRAAIFAALSQFHISNKEYPTNGLGYYSQEAQADWGFFTRVATV